MAALRQVLPLLIVASLAVGGVPAAAGAQRPLADVVQGLVARSPVGSGASVVVRDAGGEVIASVRPAVPLAPASNEKLLTIVTALRLLGPDAQLRTSLVATEPVLDGVIDGDLRLVGGGDPTFSTRAFGSRTYGIRVATAEQLAGRLRLAGVVRVTGRLLADSSLFDEQIAGPGWKQEFTPLECPPLSALTIDRATLQPALAAARRVRAALRAVGISIGAAGVAAPPASAGTTLAYVDSAPLRWLATLAGKDSDNFVAELLLKAVAATTQTPGTTRAGAAIALRTLAAFGVPTAGVRFVDGSGLSAQNRATTSELSLLLARVAADPALAAAFRQTLAVAGTDGTLEARMTRGAAHGYVLAKTGTLNGASALSGYAGPYTFSILIGGAALDQDAAHALEDAIAQVLAKRAASAG